MLKEIFTHPVFLYIAIFSLAFSMVIFSIPSIIYSSLKYKLFDTNDSHRKTHTGNISRLGGIAIFSSFIISALLFSAIENFNEANFLMIGCIILSALGLKDDVYGTNTSTKFILQIAVAVILVILGNFRLSSLYGVLNIGELNYFWGAVFSIVLIIFLNNAFNLIDGVDGLASSIGMLSTFTFGCLFAIMNNMPYAFISFSLCGALAGFLKYNWWPAKIFMGDTGSLIIGLISAALAIKFIEMNKFTSDGSPQFYSAPAIAVAILIAPIFDSLRVFCIRLYHKKSPFGGDRNHIHHRLEKIGFKPRQMVLLTVLLNTLTIAFAISFSSLGNFALIIIIIAFCICFNLFITFRLKKQKIEMRLVDNS